MNKEKHYIIDINFGGFYESVHEYILENLVEAYIRNDDDTDEELYKKMSNIIWEPLFKDYAKEYVNYLNDLFETKMVYLNLDQPQYYNYRTDVIVAKISRKDAIKILSYVNRKYKDEFKDYLKRITTSRDGYTAFFDYKELFMSENRDVLITNALTFIIKKENIVNEDYELDSSLIEEYSDIDS